MANIELRKTQYIFTFGPAAIVETPDGPNMLSSVSEVLDLLETKDLSTEENLIRITDTRLENCFLDGGKILNIPSSDETKMKIKIPVTKTFPRWNLCPEHGKLYLCYYGCPICTGKKKEESKTRKFAVRFLRICANGHLDDINWNWAVHSEKNSCNPKFYDWKGSGSLLSEIHVKCPQCGKTQDMHTIFNSKTSCSGRRPEIEDLKNKQDSEIRDECDKSMSIVQRGASNIRVAHTIASLTIPPLSTKLHSTLEFAFISDRIKTLLGRTNNDVNELKETAFRQEIDELYNFSKRINKETYNYLIKTSWSKITNALKDLISYNSAKSEEEFRGEELKALLKSSETGTTLETDDYFRVDRNKIIHELDGPENNYQFRIVPIEKLRVVIVQYSFSRYDRYDNRGQAKSILCRGKFPGEDCYWYPGVEHFGEGIFITLESKSTPELKLKGESIDTWKKFLTNNPPQEGQKWNCEKIWWHSLSHRIITALALDSGYSCASIRERIYYDFETRQGGILFYTKQAGGDGTLGGLCALAQNFDRILEKAFFDLDTCSNDPICIESDVSAKNQNGSACYACTLISETSCDHLNRYLDRKILLENLP